MADTKTSDTDVRRMIALAHDAIIVGNAIDDPTYRPYCMRCHGMVRMSKVEPFLWRHGCGAEHDERQVLAGAPPPRLVPDRPSDAVTMDEIEQHAGRPTGAPWRARRQSMTIPSNPADAVREALDDDEDDDMPRCECCLAICSPYDLTDGLCDMCCDDEDEL